jgi:hypothetical protein
MHKPGPSPSSTSRHGGNVTVQVLIREDRNHYGYIDTSVIGVFREMKSARLERMRQRRRSIANGFDVNYDNPLEDTWEVYWRIETMELD